MLSTAEFLRYSTSLMQESIIFATMQFKLTESNAGKYPTAYLITLSDARTKKPERQLNQEHIQYLISD